MDIKRTIRLLGPLLVEGALAVRQNSNERLVEMLHELEFSTKSISQNANAIEIELQILDVDLLYRLLAGEANKFLLASRVSHERSMQNQLNNASWQAIESYYAAYFGVHYLLRLTGVSITNLDSKGVAFIERSNYGPKPSFKIPGGLYVMDYDESSKILKLTKNTKKSGGSHQDAWQLWEKLIDQLCIQTNTDPVEYAALSIDLTEHKHFLIRSSSKYNPPEIRGEINYQFRGGSWVFEKGASKSVGILQRSLSTEGVPVVSVKAATPVGLISVNKFIIALAKEVFLYASNKYPKGVCRSISNKYKHYVQ